MILQSCFAESRSTVLAGGNPSNPSWWVAKLFGGGATTAAGVQVDEDSALKQTAYWAAVNVISGAIGALPLNIYRRLDPRGKERADNHPAWRLIHDRPNEYMSSQTFRETLQAHVLTGGNGYAEIERNGAGAAVNLWPLLPDRVEPKLDDAGTLRYHVRDRRNGMVTPLPAANVLHILGLGYDGLKGYSPVRYHAEAIGLAVAVKRYGANFFANGANPGGILKHPGQLSDPARKNIKESFEREHKGLEQSHRMHILEEGMDWVRTGVNPEESQCLESQKFSVSDIARIFNIPPHLLADLERATFSNIENLHIEFMTLTLDRWLRKWEIECDYKLNLGPSYFAEFHRTALLRGDTKSRFESYNIGRNGGWLSVNDIRDAENMNPIDEGDIYLEPLNMVPAGSEQPPAKPATEPMLTRRDLPVVAACEPALADAIARMVRKEHNDARRAGKKGDVSQWAKTYWPEEKLTFRAAIIPAIDSAVEAAWATRGEGQPPAEWLRAAATCAAECADEHTDAAGRFIGDGSRELEHKQLDAWSRERAGLALRSLAQKLIALQEA